MKRSFLDGTPLVKFAGRERVPQFVRFGLVGASGTVVNVAILVGLVHIFGVQPHIAYLAALEGSILSNFVLNHRFTFHKRRPLGPTRKVLSKIAAYNLISLAGAAIAWTVFTLATTKAGMQYLIADLLGIAAATAWNYWLSTTIVWPLVDDPEISRLFRKYDEI